MKYTSKFFKFTLWMLLIGFVADSGYIFVFGVICIFLAKALLFLEIFFSALD